MPSAGLSSYGYDIRLGRNFKFFKREPGLTVNQDVPTFIGENYSEDEKVTRRYVKQGSSPLIVDACCPTNEYISEIDDVDSLIIPPRGFVLGVSAERIKVPRNVSVVCMGKSTLARMGLIVIVTPLEAGWEGYVTLEILNTIDLPVRIHAGMGITQLQFFQGNEDCDVSYADRNGKYNNQPPEAVPPRL
jgi:dCTP deaminase